MLRALVDAVDTTLGPTLGAFSAVPMASTLRRDLQHGLHAAVKVWRRSQHALGPWTSAA